MKYVNTVSVNRVKKLLDYDKLTGIFKWKIQQSNRIKIGSIAGTIRDNGYIKIIIDGQLYFAHRLAWLYVTGEWPKQNIDHKNGIKNDNKFDNLREATHSENGQNRASYGKKSPAKGIYHCRGKFAVRIALGTYNTIEEAIEIRNKYFNQFQKDFVHDSIKETI